MSFDDVDLDIPVRFRCSVDERKGPCTNDGKTHGDQCYDKLLWRLVGLSSWSSKHCPKALVKYAVVNCD